MPRREGPDAIPLNGGVTQGNEPVPGASLTITDKINGGNAALYSDEFLTTPTANPVTCDGQGRFSVFVRPGQYGFTVPSGADAMDDVVIGSGASSPSTTPPMTKSAVRAAATANVTSLSAPQTIDGVALVAGDRVLLTAQSTGAQNGIWVVQAAAWTRPVDFEAGTTQQPGALVPVAAGGTANGSTEWELSNTTGVVVGTGSPTFVNIGSTGVAHLAGAETFTGLKTFSAGLLNSSPTQAGGYATGAGGAVTQATDATTGVAINKPTGQITTVALTTAAGAEERFTVSNTTVAATDTIIVGTTYAGAGTPAVSVMKIAANAFDIVITNLHASAALNAAVVVNFAVYKGVAA